MILKICKYSIKIFKHFLKMANKMIMEWFKNVKNNFKYIKCILNLKLVLQLLYCTICDSSIFLKLNEWQL